MLRLLRITVMWLLALAVPVQGFAAASMIGCATGRHGPVLVHSHAAGMHEHHGDSHSPAPADHQHLLAGDGHDQAGQAGHAKLSKATCSACAACCTSAALPAAPIVFEAADAPDVFVQLALQRLVSFVSGGLERPPRPILA